MAWNKGRPCEFAGGFSGSFTSSFPSRITMNPPMPLSKSASALHVISVPDCVEDTCTLIGGGGVASLVEPVLTYSVRPRPGDGFVRQPDGVRRIALILSLGLSAVAHQGSEPRLARIHRLESLIRALFGR